MRKLRLVTLPLLCAAICAGTLSSCKPGDSSSTPSGGTSSTEQVETIDKAELPTGWEAKGEMNTFYQTGAMLDPRTLLQTDFVKLCFGAGAAANIEGMIKSYTEAVIARQVMADIGVAQDGGEYFTGGGYDGVEHKDIVIRKKDGSIWQFGLLPGLPYILPTKEWNDYLADIALRSIEAGAFGVTLQEIGVFGDTGYEQAFRDEWKDYYGTDWSDQLWDDPNLYFMGQNLRNYLSTEQVRQVFTAVKEKYPDAMCTLANHTSMAYYGFMNACGNHDLAMLDVVDAIEAQTWSNTIELGITYNGKTAPHPFVVGFFEYSYWANLGKQVGNKPVYFITDPKGDGYDVSGKTLEQCKSLYQHQIVSQLAFSSVYRYNSVVWPDRSYSFGFDGTPVATDAYRTIMNNIVTVQNQMNKYQEPVSTTNKDLKVGVMVLDTACYQAGGPDGGASANDQFSMFTGLMFNGVMAEAVPFGTNDSKEDVLKNYDMLIVSYDSMKPMNDLCNKKLKEYMENGGTVLFMGGKGTYEDIDAGWWKEAGYASPQDALFADLGINTTGRTKNMYGTMEPVSGSLAESVGSISSNGNKIIGYDTVEGANALYTKDGKTTAFEKEVGNGHFVYLGIDPLAFTANGMGDVQFKLVQEIAAQKLSKTVESQKGISYRRGPYLGISAVGGDVESEKGTFINMFDEKLSVVDGLTVKNGESALLLDVADKMNSNKPVVLFAQGNNPTIAEYGNITRVVTAGPSKTQGTVRIYVPDGYTVSTVTAVDPNGRDLFVSQEYDSASKTLLVTYDNHINKVTIDVEYTA